MNVEQLRSFLEIAETASFYKAAERLGSTQPTISARIKSLEELLGRQLFHRAKNGVTLTESGHRFYQYAIIAVTALEHGRAEVRLPQGFDHVVGVGLQSYLALELAPFLIREVQRTLQGTAIRIEPEYSEAIVQHVSVGLLDLGVVYVPKIVSGLEVERLGSQQVVLAATPGLERNRDRLLTGYIQVNWGQEFLQVQNEALGADVTPATSVGAPRMALDLLFERGGAAYLDRRMIHDALENGRLRIVQSSPSYSRPVYLVWPSRRRTVEHTKVGEIIKRWFHEEPANSA